VIGQDFFLLQRQQRHDRTPVVVSQSLTDVQGPAALMITSQNGFWVRVQQALNYLVIGAREARRVERQITKFVGDTCARLIDRNQCLNDVGTSVPGARNVQGQRSARHSSSADGCGVQLDQSLNNVNGRLTLARVMKWCEAG